MEEDSKKELCSKLKNSEELKRFLATPVIKQISFRCNVTANINGRTEGLVWVTLAYKPTSPYNEINCNNYDLFVTEEGYLVRRSQFKDKSTFIKNAYWKFF